MCGRLTQASPVKRIVDGFQIREFMEYGCDERLRHPRYNVKPDDNLFVMTLTDRGRVLRPMRWGFHLPGKPRPIFNARRDKLASSPLWRGPFKHSRCIVPANGFYEWPKGPGRGKQARYIYLASGEPMGFAGLWRDEGGLPVCSICTCEPNELVKSIPHDRMPVILELGQFDQWLDPGNQDVVGLESMVQTYPEDRMAMHTVGPWVNKRGEGKRCVEGVGDGESGEGLWGAE